MPMKLKTIEVEGKVFAEVRDGKPIYVADDGKEIPVDANQAFDKITQLQGEARGHREAKETAEAALKAFEGIEDPTAALKAIQTMSALDQKKLIDAGQVETIRNEAIKSVEDKYAPVVQERDTLRGQLDREIRGGSFLRSKFAEEKVAVPRHMLEKTYGDNFKIEDGKLVPYDANGKPIFSRIRHGEVADFDEALEILISADPFKDSILKGQVGTGGGAANGGAASAAGTKSITRADFAKLTPQDQMNKVTVDGFTVVD